LHIQVSSQMFLPIRFWYIEFGELSFLGSA
jgi:hypothetical protein